MSSNHLKEKYLKEIVPQLAKEMGLKNRLAVPKVEKVVVNMGIGEGSRDKGVIEPASQDLAVITGQKPKVARARKAEAGFKLRAGAPIGLVVTLRGKRMYDFLEKLFKIVLPRLRDFQGVSAKSFDGRGNYNLGIGEQTVFPEIDYAKVDKTRGLEITIVTGAADDQKAKRLLELLGMPFEKPKTRR
jgi:large subunit ribosomal protein L5